MGHELLILPEMSSKIDGAEKAGIGEGNGL
jgi:hypothetical protein